MIVLLLKASNSQEQCVQPLAMGQNYIFEIVLQLQKVSSECKPEVITVHLFIVIHHVL